VTTGRGRVCFRMEDRRAWAEQVELSHFVNAYYQLRDLRLCAEAGTVLIVGPGQGLSPVVLGWKRYRVTTVDVDAILRPDVLGSVQELGMFRDGTFDAVIASHVLEHLSEASLDDSLKEIARVGRFAIVYLPVAGLHAQLSFRSNFRDFDFAGLLDLRNPVTRADPTRPRFMEGQHFWEVGLPGFRVRDLLLRFGQWFEVLDCYRNRDWLPSQNFVLKSRRPPATGGPR
jgi:hypothetical protein